MIFLHTSDWHLGKSLYDFSLLEDQAHFINWLLELLLREPVDAVLLSGDIYDRPVPSGAAVALYDHFLTRAVGDLGIPVLAVAGNHDSPGRLQFGSSLYRKSGYHVAGFPEAAPQTVVLSDRLGEVEFHLLPYLHLADARSLFPEGEVRSYDDGWRLLLEGHRKTLDSGRRHVAVAHGFFGKLGDGEREPLTSDSEITAGGMDLVDCAHFQGYDYVALGHLHAPQNTGEGIRYSGTPLPYSLSEEHQQKSVTLVTLEERGQVLCTPVPVPAPHRVRTVRGTLEQLLEPSYHEDKEFGDYVFAEIEGEECAYPMQKLRTLFPRLLGLRFSANLPQEGAPLPRLTAQQKIARLSTGELFHRFYREMRGQEMPGAHRMALEEALEALEREEATV